MTSHYEAFTAAFLHGRALQDDVTVAVTAAQAPRLPLHYFKRVPLLPRIHWAIRTLRFADNGFERE